MQRANAQAEALPEILHGVWNGCNVAFALLDKKIIDLYVEKQSQPNLVGGIARATVRQLRNSGGGNSKNGNAALAFLDLPAQNGKSERAFIKTKQKLSPGQKIIVQVSAFNGGIHDTHKAWPVSAELKLQGYRLIHLINGKDIHASQRLTDAAALKAVLKQANLPGGWILRHHASTLDEASLLAEAAALMARAADIKLDTNADDWLLAPPTSLQRALLDYPNAAASELDETTLDDWLRPLTSQRIELADGGKITISPTQALLAIDVDSGSGSNLAATNELAARQIASALRNRNLSGQIVIDFCRTPDQRPLLQKFETMLQADPQKTTLHGATRMGLVELTRPRSGASLYDILQDVKP